MKGCMSPDLDLHDAPDHHGGHQTCMTSGARTTQLLRRGSTRPGSRCSTQPGDQREDPGVACHDLRDHRGVEVLEDLQISETVAPIRP